MCIYYIFALVLVAWSYREKVNGEYVEGLHIQKGGG